MSPIHLMDHSGEIVLSILAVNALVLEAGGDEDQAIAALLRDAVEDQGGMATLKTIRHLFGEWVANAVESCSDSTVSDPAKKLPWRERKELYLAHLRDANADGVDRRGGRQAAQCQSVSCGLSAAWGGRMVTLSCRQGRTALALQRACRNHQRDRSAGGARGRIG